MRAAIAVTLIAVLAAVAVAGPGVPDLTGGRKLQLNGEDERIIHFFYPDVSDFNLSVIGAYIQLANGDYRIHMFDAQGREHFYVAKWNQAIGKWVLYEMFSFPWDLWEWPIWVGYIE